MAVSTPVSVRMSEALDAATVGPGYPFVGPGDANGNPTGAVVTGTVSLASAAPRSSSIHLCRWRPGRTFVARFTGGVADAGGTLYTGGPVEWSFTTSPP